MNTELIARTQFPAGLRRWLYTGLLVLLALTLYSVAPARQIDPGGYSSAAVASNGSGGGCG